MFTPIIVQKQPNFSETAELSLRATLFSDCISPFRKSNKSFNNSALPYFAASKTSDPVSRQQSTICCCCGSAVGSTMSPGLDLLPLDSIIINLHIN
uniref:Uncharacterized protein n=1 Tax=Romanomermis culicivorax TaxID=13658 RepID=A0A915IJ53_ROMCU